MRMTKLAKSILLGGTLLTAAVGVGAEPFYLVVPDGAGNDADNQTAVSYQLGIDFEATSTYIADNDSSYDGINAWTWVTAGDSVNDTGEGSVSSLLQSNGVSWTGNNNTEGLGATWNLTFDYSIFGAVAIVDNSQLALGSQGIGALYNSGVIEITYNALDPNTGGILDSTRVMDLVVYGSTGTIGNVNIFAHVDFSSAEIDAALANGLFFFADGTDFYDLWLAGQPLPDIVINARIDTNVDPQLIPTCDDADCTTVSRTNTLNGSVQFDRAVPVPGTLLLLGAGLLGLSWSRRSARKA